MKEERGDLQVQILKSRVSLVLGVGRRKEILKTCAVQRLCSLSNGGYFPFLYDEFSA